MLKIILGMVIGVTLARVFEINGEGQGRLAWALLSLGLVANLACFGGLWWLRRHTHSAPPPQTPPLNGESADPPPEPPANRS